MGRIVQTGFEQNSTTGGIDFTTSNVSGGGAVAISTSNVRTGTYSFRVSNAGASGIARGNMTLATSAGNGPYYFRIYMYPVSNAGALDTIIMIWDGTTARAQLRWATDNTLELWDSSAKIGSSSAAMSLNTSYILELSYYNNTVSGKAELAARLGADDGSTPTTFASTTTSTNTGTLDRVSWGICNNGTGYDAYFDDLAVNDSTGSYHTSWVGHSKILRLNPNAPGDNSMWDGDDGTSDPVNPHLYLDEVTPDDATSFLRSRTTNDITDVNIQDSGLNSYDTINAIQVWTRGNRSSGTTSSAFVTRIKASSGGTVDEGGAETASSTTWRTNDMDTNNATPVSLTSYVKPGTSDPWTASDVDTMQIGVRCSSGSGDRYAQVSTLFVYVDYTPGSAPTFIPTTTMF